MNCHCDVWLFAVTDSCVSDIAVDTLIVYTLLVGSFSINLRRNINQGHLIFYNFIWPVSVSYLSKKCLKSVKFVLKYVTETGPCGRFL